MRPAHILAACLWAALLGGCYEAAPAPDQSFVLPVTGGNSTPSATDGNGGITTGGNGTPMQVAIGGTVTGLFDGESVVLANGGSRVTVTRNGAFSFSSTIGAGEAYSIYVVNQPMAQACLVAAPQGNAPSTGVTVSVSCSLQLRFAQGQAARAVIGQTSFTSYARNFNQTVASSTSCSNPWGTSFTADSGVVYLSDSLNSRILGFDTLPATNGVAADFLAGQPDFAATDLGCSATAFGYVSGLASDKRGGLLVVDMVNHRVLMFAHEFTTNLVPASGVIGQTSLDANIPACSATGLNRPLSAATDGNILAVGDASNNRVLLWATLPSATSTATPATMVLGQPDLATCNIPAAPTAQTIKAPQGVWTNGQMLAVVAVNENRILFWHNLPTLIANAVDGVAADTVIGQTDLTSSVAAAGPSGLAGPQYIVSDGSQFIVGDTNNNRVLIYPTLNPGTGQAASGVLGQADFTAVAPHGGTAGLSAPSGLGISNKSLIVSDAANSRFLVFDSL